MSETYFVDININEWTDISQGNVAGFFSNKSGNDVLYLKNETLPATTILKGHTLRPRTSVNFAITSPEVVYARSIRGNATIVVTP